MATSFFTGAQHLTIEGGNFSSVNGNQINNNNTTYQYIYTKQKKERTEYDDFYKVKPGAIDRIKEISYYTYPRRWDDGYRWATEEGFARADKVICTARVNGEEGKVFMVVSYSGPEAQEEFEKDFRLYSSMFRPNLFRLYGFNRSVIPSLIFSREFLPATHLSKRLGFWEQLYLRTLALQLGCWCSEIWMDPSTGVLCRGPECSGEISIRCEPLPISNIPSDLNVLQEDVYLRYLTSLETDARRVIVDIINSISETQFGELWVSNVFQPTVSAASTNTTVAVGSTNWWIDGKLFGMRKVLASGVTRFVLLEEAHGEHYFTLKTRLPNDKHAWLSQALSVFCTCGISLEDDMRDYKLLLPRPELEGHLSDCEERSRKAIYLFVPPLPSTPLDSERYAPFASHYWSSYHTGEPRLSPDECRSLGLPNTLLLSVFPSRMYSWDATAYRAMHQLQTAKGFDPTTTAFAEYLEYPIYRVLQSNPGRFEEVDNSEISNTKEEPSGRQDTKSSNPWSLLTSAWSWSTSDDSDIPAVAI